MPNSSSSPTTTLTRILSTALVTASAMACDQGAQQGAVGNAPEARLIELTDDLAIYFVELEGETRRVEVSVPTEGDEFRILDGDRLALEVRDTQDDGPEFRAPDQRAWSIDASCDPLTESVAEFVLDGGLAELDEDDVFRAAAPCMPCYGYY